MGKKLIDKLSKYNQNCDKELLLQAFEFAEERYQKFDMDINYVCGVLEILFMLKPDEPTIITVLLYPLYLMGKLDDDVIKDRFGQSVVELLQSIKKIEALNYAQNDKSSQVEILRKMFLSMAKDLRSIFITLAFRLYKMEYLDDMLDKETKQLIAKETLYVYVPIAERLGMYRIKTKLEDLAFQYAKPLEYQYVMEELEALGDSRKTLIEEVKKELILHFKKQGIDNVEVSGRLKSNYSIYKKMRRKNLSSLDELYDIFAMRVIVPSVYDKDGKEKIDHIYSILGMVHSKWKPLSKRFKDYVAVPKANGYMSLHTVVLGLAPKYLDQPVEIQFRSRDMHESAENGFASHWLYKTSTSSKADSFRSRIEWLRTLESLTESLVEQQEGMKEVELDIFKDRIFVLTPRGEVKDLPVGSCPIDFAYAVHTDVGHTCVMAKVNGSVVPLDYHIRNGDVVNIITKKGSNPKLQWLSVVASSGAKSKIKAWFSNQEKESNLKEGRRLINAQLERIGKPPLDPTYSILKGYLGNKLNISERELLIEEVGKGAQLASDIIRKVFPYEQILVLNKSESKDKEDLSSVTLKEDLERKELHQKVLIGGESGLPIKFASCCSPQYGDKIVAYVTRGNRITVHQFECSLLNSLNADRVIKANWMGKSFAPVSRFTLKLEIKTLTRVGMARDIINIIASMEVNIRDMSIKGQGQFAKAVYALDFDDLNKFDRLIDKLEMMEGVLEVKKLK